MKVCTVNVGTLVGRSRELVEMAAQRKNDICCIQETRYRNSGCKTFGANDQKYKFWYSGQGDGLGGVGVMARAELAGNVLEIERYSNRLMKVKIILGESISHIFSVYAPQSGRTAQEKADFYEKLEDEIGRVPVTDHLIVGGDMNGHIGMDRAGYEEVLGRYGFGDRNAEGEPVLDLCKNHDLRVLNTYFKKPREKLITYKSGELSTQLDLILMRTKRGIVVTDCYAAPGEACLTQHRPVCAILYCKDYRRTRRVPIKRIKLWKLKDEELRREYEAKLQEKVNQGIEQADQLEKNIREAAEEVCGLTTGRRGRERETWWWCDEVQQKIKEKKIAYKAWQHTKTEADKEHYREKNRESKRAVARAKAAAWEGWSADLTTVAGRNKMFRAAAQMRKDKRDVVGTNYIKDENGNIMMEKEKVAGRWRNYFSELANVENENYFEETTPVEGPIEIYTKEEVMTALKGMKNGKAPGPSGINSEMVKYAGNTGVEQLLLLFQQVFEEERCPELWKMSHSSFSTKAKGIHWIVPSTEGSDYSSIV